MLSKEDKRNLHCFLYGGKSTTLKDMQPVTLEKAAALTKKYHESYSHLIQGKGVEALERHSNPD